MKQITSPLNLEVYSFPSNDTNTSFFQMSFCSPGLYLQASTVIWSFYFRSNGFLNIYTLPLQSFIRCCIINNSFLSLALWLRRFKWSNIQYELNALIYSSQIGVFYYCNCNEQQNQLPSIAYERDEFFFTIKLHWFEKVRKLSHCLLNKAIRTYRWSGE